MPTPDDQSLPRFEGFPGGVNNRIRETETGPDGGFLREAVNVDLSTEGKPRRRPGYAQAIAGYAHSLWRHPSLPFALAVIDGRLVTLEGPDLYQTDLGAIDLDSPVSYALINDTVYFSNNRVTGRVTPAKERLPWGLPLPQRPVLAATTGFGLHEGCYQVTATYVDVDGVEHGAPEPVAIDLDADAGLEVTVNGPWPSRVDYVQVYATQAGGETLHASGQLAAPGTILLTPNALATGRPLDTLFRTPPPPGHLVREYRGRIYIAMANIVFFTDPLRYEVVSPATSVFVFPATVTLLEPSHDGLYVGHGSAIDWLGGADPYDMQRRLVASHAVVPGSGAQVPGRFLGSALDYVPVWWAQNYGYVAGFPSGDCRLLTADRLSTEDFGAGIITPWERDGATQLMATLRQPGQGAAKARDSVVAEVRRST